MAKKTETPAIVNAAEVTTGIENFQEQAKESIIIQTIKTREELQITLEQYNALSFKGLQDKVSYDNAKKGLRALKKTQKQLNDSRLDYTRPALEFQKNLKSFADEIIGEIEPTVKHLTKITTDFEDAELKQKNELRDKRMAELMELNYHLQGERLVLNAVYGLETSLLMDMSEEDFQSYVEAGKEETKRIEAENKRKAEEEAERKRKEAELAERERKLNEQKAEMERQREESEKKMAAMQKQMDEMMKKLNPEPEPEAVEVKHPEPEVKPEPVKKSPAVQKSSPAVKNNETDTTVNDPAQYDGHKQYGYDLAMKRVTQVLNHKTERMDRGSLRNWINASKNFREEILYTYEQFKSK